MKNGRNKQFSSNNLGGECRRWLIGAWPACRRAAVALLGTVVLLAGVVMIITPGPAAIVIPAGLAILATEFEWARHLLRSVRQRLRTAAQR
ncbi:MAG: PGPGW domain-containing protein, partial [Planctomycetaceae bacterium]